MLLNSNSSVLLGVVIGFVFGFADVVMTWLNPVEDDSVGVLLRFYGPMFLIWGLSSFRAARSTGRMWSGVTTGAMVAFTTFCVFVALNFLRVNLFLDQLTGRPDWQNMMLRFRTSGSENLRLFVNLNYLKGTPFKIGAATVFGLVFGTLGGTLALLTRPRKIETF